MTLIANDDKGERVQLGHFLKSQIFSYRKLPPKKNEVEFCQKFIGAIR